MVAKRFFFVSAGILCLALAYHLGATTVMAQSPGFAPVGIGFSGDDAVVLTANGDVYRTENIAAGPWVYAGNPLVGGIPTPAVQQSWGQVKARYR